MPSGSHSPAVAVFPARKEFNSSAEFALTTASVADQAFALPSGKQLLMLWHLSHLSQTVTSTLLCEPRFHRTTIRSRCHRALHRSPQEPRRLGGRFSLAGSRLALCFNASFSVRGRWCFAKRSAKASSASACKSLPLSRDKSSSACKVCRVEADQLSIGRHGNILQAGRADLKP